MIRKLSKSVREFKLLAMLTPVFVSLEVVLECIIPLIIANFVNEIKHHTGDDMSHILKYGGILVLLAILSLTFGSVAGITSAKASCGFGRNLRRDMFSRIQSYSFENIDRFSSSSLVTRITTDVTNVQNAFMMIIRIAIRAPLMLIFAFFMAFNMGGKMAIIFVCVIPFLGVGLMLIIRKAFPLFRRVFKKYDVLNNSIQENVKGMRVVKSFVREKHESKKFDLAAGDVCRDFTEAERVLAFNSPLMMFSMYSVMVFVMTYGSYTVISSRALDLDVGQMSALLTYGFMMLSSLMMLSMIVVMITMAGESAKRICEIITEESTIISPDSKNAVFAISDGSVELDGVSFRYSEKAERMALKNITLSIKSGETVGIIGGTGSSKSTLIQLIPRLYDATEGTVKVGGIDVRNYDLDTLRQGVAVVLQKNVLFSGTVKENLRWGDPNATDEEMEDACRMACASEFVEALPGKYDYYIEQGGANLSGGQKQRLCIARALLKRPKILILDDSTSAVDTRTDASIRQAMRDYIPETTKIIIAQRISSVQDADKIVVLEGGGINAVGTHDELMKTCDVYREIYVSQNKAGDNDE